MTVLVTGGAGYIGSHMCWLLADNDESFIVVDDLSTGNKDAIPKSGELIVGDIGDIELISTLIKKHNVDSVIHFAGSIIVPESVSNPLKYYSNNTAKSRNLIEACVNNKVENFIFSSTAAVYGIPEKVPVVEELPIAPISPYGSSKSITEMMLRDCAEAYDFRYVALRYFNVAGADLDGRTGQSTPEATHLIKVANQVALGQRSHLEIYGTDYPTPDGTGVRDYIHVCDLAAAHWLALKHLRTGGDSKVFNCGYGHGYSVLEVVRTLESIVNHEIPVKRVARRPGDTPEVVADSNKLKQTFDWKPQFDDLRTIIDSALRWERHLASSSK